MLKKRVLVIFLSCILVFLISLLFTDTNKETMMFTKMISLTTDKLSSGLVDNNLKVEEVNTSEQPSEKNETQAEKQMEEITNTDETTRDTQEEVQPETPEIVYDGLTMDELASKLERSMKNELSGKGYLYASYSLEKGVDPYLALAISLEETGCNWNCSNLVKSCNNVGGMKGSGCGSYSAWPTLDDGIKAFIDNIYRNYVAYGLTTADTMNPKYAENPAWSTNVNRYISSIKNN